MLTYHSDPMRVQRQTIRATGDGDDPPRQLDGIVESHARVSFAPDQPKADAHLPRQNMQPDPCDTNIDVLCFRDVFECNGSTVEGALCAGKPELVADTAFACAFPDTDKVFVHGTKEVDEVDKAVE